MCSQVAAVKAQVARVRAAVEDACRQVPVGVVMCDVVVHGITIIIIIINNININIDIVTNITIIIIIHLTLLFVHRTSILINTSSIHKKYLEKSGRGSSLSTTATH